MKTITLTKPDDWHVHFRDEPFLKDTVSATAKHFARALVMPNLIPPLISADLLLDYQRRILAASKYSAFHPYMTLYLNEQLTPEEIARASRHADILGAKLYPAGATTNAQSGAQSIKAIYPQLEALQENNLVLQIHGEIAEGDIFKREAVFVENYLKPICKNFPRLRIVLEHISTAAAAQFVIEANEHVAATITPHHLMFNRNQLLAGGIRPHYYCLPILKSSHHQTAIQQAAISGNPKFFAGTDSAPHAQFSKENACGCAGIYSAPYAVAMYAEVFEQNNALRKLDSFMGQFGAEFYQLPVNQNKIEVIKMSQTVPEVLSFGEQNVIPVLAGEQVSWSVHA